MINYYNLIYEKKRPKSGFKMIWWTVSTLEGMEVLCFLPSKHFLFAFLTCAQRTRVYYCPQHWLLCHLSFVLVRGRVPQAVTKKTAGFPGFDPLSISPVRCLFPRIDVLTLYSIESTTIALVLNTSLLLHNSILWTSVRSYSQLRQVRHCAKSDWTLLSSTTFH